MQNIAEYRKKPLGTKTFKGLSMESDWKDKKNSRNANGRISLFGRKNQSICRVGVLTCRFTDCITSVSHPNLREVFGLDYFGIAQRKEDGLFLFSQVQPFHDGIAHPLCSECAEVESEGNYRFKVVKLHAALVG